MLTKFQAQSASMSCKNYFSWNSSHPQKSSGNHVNSLVPGAHGNGLLLVPNAHGLDPVLQRLNKQSNDYK